MSDDRIVELSALLTRALAIADALEDHLTCALLTDIIERLPDSSRP